MKKMLLTVTLLLLGVAAVLLVVLMPNGEAYCFGEQWYDCVAKGTGSGGTKYGPANSRQCASSTREAETKATTALCKSYRSTDCFAVSSASCSATNSPCGR